MERFSHKRAISIINQCQWAKFVPALAVNSSSNRVEYGLLAPFVVSQLVLHPAQTLDQFVVSSRNTQRPQLLAVGLEI
jgi:hypothetical protein